MGQVQNSGIMNLVFFRSLDYVRKHRLLYWGKITGRTGQRILPV
jgi:hypothetical protein